MVSEASTSNKAQKPKGSVFRFVFKALIVIAAIAGIFFVVKMPSKSSDVPAEEPAPLNVSVMTVSVEPNFKETFDLPAVVEPNRVVTVSAEISGTIEFIPVVKGDLVKTGDLLIRLNSDLIRPQVEMAKAQLDRDQIQFDRMKKLVESDATARSDLDDVTTKLAVSKASLENVTAQLKRSSIYSPISGILNSLPVEKGEYLQPGMPVAEIVETGIVKVAVDIPEKDISFIKVADEVNIQYDYKDKQESLTGKITFVSELADSMTRSVHMEVTVPNKQHKLHSGQIVRMMLTRRNIDNAVLIPLSAVIPMENENAVYVVNGAKDELKAQRKIVKLGLIKGDNVEITDGLKPGDKLIVAGHRFVAPEQKVKIVSEKE
jgi:membrane fusion protein, multidrug efflux system